MIVSSETSLHLLDFSVLSPGLVLDIFLPHPDMFVERLYTLLQVYLADILDLLFRLVCYIFLQLPGIVFRRLDIFFVLLDICVL